MNYESFEQLTSMFVEGKITPHKQISVGDLSFKYVCSSTFSLNEIVNENQTGGMIFAAEQPNTPWLVFVWETSNTRLVPVGVKQIDRAAIITEQEERDPNHIPDIVEVKITSLPNSSSVKGRVDTGATLCSLHADRWKKVGNVVEFVSPALSNSVISVPLVNMQAVASPDGGVEYRPVIELNIKINGKPLKDVQFNLNNRDGMGEPILVGQNALEKGRFLIDPSLIRESKINVNWDKLDQEIANVTGPNKVDNTEKIQQVYNVLKESNITLAELVEYIRTEIAQTLESIEY